MLVPTLLASLALIRPAVGSQVYFRQEGDAYQHSPEVLPSREFFTVVSFVTSPFCSLTESLQIAQITGQDEWAAAFAKAKTMVDQMTLEEKVSGQLYGCRSNVC